MLWNEDVPTILSFYIQARCATQITGITVDFCYDFERSKLALNYLKDFHCCNIYKFNKQSRKMTENRCTRLYNCSSSSRNLLGK